MKKLSTAIVCALLIALIFIAKDKLSEKSTVEKIDKVFGAPPEFKPSRKVFVPEKREIKKIETHAKENE
jgi:predicted RNase H-like nuclease (RuvC/YqgF family)